MEMPQLLLLVLLGLRSYTSCLKLPAYIKPCSRNDPNINACAKEHAIYAIPHFINGDPKYKVPVLEPLQIEELTLSQYSTNIGLSFTATNLTFSGLKNVQVKDIRIDLQNQHNVYELFFPCVDVHFRYNVSGHVLRLPITGRGNGVILFKDLDLRIDFDFGKARKTTKKKEYEYMLPKKLTFTTEPHGMTIHLNNLFNGNKFLGDTMNMVLNDNWRELVRDLAPPIGEAVNEVVKKILTNIFELVPFDEYFPETV